MKSSVLITISESDAKVGKLRILSAFREMFPSVKCDLEIIFKTKMFNLKFNPRIGSGKSATIYLNTLKHELNLKEGNKLELVKIDISKYKLIKNE
jgi:hypothetical protein